MAAQSDQVLAVVRVTFLRPTGSFDPNKDSHLAAMGKWSANSAQTAWTLQPATKDAYTVEAIETALTRNGYQDPEYQIQLIMPGTWAADES
ncbi:hypothetical protein IV38_GL001516 [Lactobacillus selangorensis]|uniref:Uncharacterized protein n=1 Tax=Lactobacillus selangorensis TaxID=81857 RepID=A0A0R2FIN3_9LACO|nr:hypothetical protein [Lactobacillus selangorensis]KRN28514.1 hypothetical protein IV38_GL001516 [Lactobacillus selangorensis]KRN32014.1 hypothetical protein IV40_GL001302 [Lactobacillus selangorensis]